MARINIGDKVRYSAAFVRQLANYEDCSRARGIVQESKTYSGGMTVHVIDWEGEYRDELPRKACSDVLEKCR